MNAKRMLSILLTLCLMLSLLAPAASAVTAGEDAYVGAETQQNGEKTEVSGMDKYFVNGDRSQAQKTLWNTPGESTVLSTGKGQWTATESDKEYETTLNSQLPVGVQELKEAAEYYAEDEAWWPSSSWRMPHWQRWATSPSAMYPKQPPRLCWRPRTP